MKTKKLKELCRFSVAGAQYGDYQSCPGLKAGAKLTLTWERGNRFDPNAIRIDCGGVKLGYVPKGEYQDMLHEHREQRIKIYASLVAYNKNNPTWHMLTVKCMVHKVLVDSDNESF